MTFPSLHTWLGWVLGQALEEQAAWTDSRFLLRRKLKESRLFQIMIRSHINNKAQATSLALPKVPITSIKFSTLRVKCTEGLVGSWLNTTRRALQIKLDLTNLIIPIGNSMNLSKFLPVTNTLSILKTEIPRWLKCNKKVLACITSPRISRNSIRCHSSTSTIRILKMAIQYVRMWARV